MLHLHFNLAIIQFLADHRNFYLTKFFLFFTVLGDTNGYIVIATAIYVMYNKKLALRLAVLVLFASCLDQALKLMIKNPRPFVTQGTYSKNWAVSPGDMQGLVSDYSTPSGHALCSASFYPCLYAFTNNRIVRILSIIAPILIGLSRPYLGVHYVEDILLGWAIGLALAAAAVRYTERLEELWESIGYRWRIFGIVAVSIVACIVIALLNSSRLDYQERTFMSYAGFLTGVVIAYPIETKTLRFNPKSSSILFKILRFILSVALVIGTIWLLNKASSYIAGKTTIAGDLLEYVCYCVAGVVSIYGAPLLFTRLGLATVD